MVSDVKKREYEVVKEGHGSVLRINSASWTFTPSIENNYLCMARVIDYLIDTGDVVEIVLQQSKLYRYDYDQTRMLVEVANLYKLLMRDKKYLTLYMLEGRGCSGYVNSWRVRLQEIIINLLKADPLGSYVELKRELRNTKILIKKVSANIAGCCKDYISILEDLLKLFENLELIKRLKDQLAGYVVGDRSLYFLVFRPMITPDFMITKLMARQPLDGEELDVYNIGNGVVTIFKIPQDIKSLYHLMPPEFKISEDKYELLEAARRVLEEHKPKQEEFLDPDKMRRTFFNIGKDLLQELAEHRGIMLEAKEINEVASILVRYTVGFGVIELLLEDKRIQDININGPIGQTPIYIIHEIYGECVTNIIPSREDAESWATKFRILSGRPLDEANPILDTELLLPGSRSRVAIIQQPLNPFGLGYALRRHRDKPWTYPLFIQNKMINPLAAGLLSFFVDGARTLLFAGTRSSGKTSLLGSTLIEIMRKYRVITVEDTLELPTESLRQLGYNIQSMKVRSALTKGGTEVEADEGIRTSLRLGDSSLIVGEIRSTEALALYEAMRIGALANVVAGTIHGDSPYGVFDRVVNDLKVPRTSFKATDIIIISNPVKSSDGLSSWRRVVSITEVRKHWEEDPLREKGFVDLMKYDVKKDELVATDDLINGDSEILKSIAGNVKEWVGDWEAIWQNILLRSKIKEKIIEYSERLKRYDLLEAEFVVKANDAFHRMSGEVEDKRVMEEFELWLRKEVK